MLVSLVVDTAAESSGGVSSEDEEEGGGEVVYGATDLSFEAVPYNETSFASLPPQTPNFGAHMVDVRDVAPGKEGERGADLAGDLQPLVPVRAPAEALTGVAMAVSLAAGVVLIHQFPVCVEWAGEAGIPSPMVAVGCAAVTLFLGLYTLFARIISSSLSLPARSTSAVGSPGVVARGGGDIGGGQGGDVEFVLSSTHYVLGADGAIKEQPWEQQNQVMRNFTVTTQRVLERENSDVSQTMARAAVVDLADMLLTLLDDAFVIRTDVDEGHEDHSWDEPTHVWRSARERKAFLHILTQMAGEMETLLLETGSLIRVQDPVYVLGDLHGNYADLDFFGKTFWGAGVSMSPAKLLFLGDYVDRGPHSVETFARVLALAAKFPAKVFALRGNHECRDTNGDLELFGDRSFRAQTADLCDGNEEKGDELWSILNDVMDALPLAAVISGKIFAVHGGIPRSLPSDPLRVIESIPRPLSADDIDAAMDDDEEDDDGGDTDDEMVSAKRRGAATAMDLLWSDPATWEQEEDLVDAATARSSPLSKIPPGFGVNTRGGGTVVFGHDAVDRFVKTSGCSHIIRAHQAPDLGYSYAKGAKVITIFSSSHYCGGHNSAAIALVADAQIRVMVTKRATRVFG